MNKQEIRSLYKTKRISISEKDRIKLDDLLLIRFQELYLNGVETVLSYWPIEKLAEINTHLITDFMAFRIPGMQLAYPKINAVTNTLDAYAVDDHTSFQINSYGIAEPSASHLIYPEEIDLIITPLLAFDESGYRVGYGKGFYDKFLAQCRPDIIKLGFSYFGPLTVIDDIDDFDVPLNICITPQKVYEF